MNTSVGSVFQHSTQQYMVRVYVLGAFHEVKYDVDVEENYGFIHEDDPWFPEMVYSQLGTKLQEKI